MIVYQGVNKHEGRVVDATAQWEYSSSQQVNELSCN